MFEQIVKHVRMHNDKMCSKNPDHSNEHTTRLDENELSVLVLKVFGKSKKSF